MFKRFSISLAIFSLVLVGCNPTGGKTSVLNVDEVTSTKALTEYIAYDGEDGKTVLELLQKMAKVQAEVVEGGTVVNAIDGLAWDYANNKSWYYVVNGQVQEVLPDQYVTKNGDKVEWRYGSLGE